MNQNVMNSEMAILTSFDLAAKVATNFGPDKILAKLGGGSSATAAASAVQAHLKVESMKDSSVIYVIFRHPDPDLVQPVLSEIISDYLDKHTKVHSAIGMSDDLLDERITQLRLEIAQTEDLLRIEKTNAGIISVADTEKSYSEEMARIHDELLQARASLFEHQTSLKELAVAESKGGITNTILNVPVDQVEHYKSVCSQLNFFQQRENNYIQQGYTEENKLMRENREQILATTKSKTGMEKQFPALADLDTTTAVASSDTARVPSPGGNSEEIALLPVRIKVLEAQLADVQSEAAKLNDAEAKIADLERTYKVQDNNLTYYENLRDQTRIDAQLGPNRNSNISEIQNPEPAYRDYNKFYKIVGGLACSGLLLGLAWAFLIELYLDRSVKRPVDLEKSCTFLFPLHPRFEPQLAPPPRRVRAEAARLQWRQKGRGHQRHAGNHLAQDQSRVALPLRRLARPAGELF